MMIADLIHSCSNAFVARAALASIGGCYVERVRALTPEAELSPGAYAARAVRRFAEDAGDRDWAELNEAAQGAQQPLLAGLRFIVDRALEDDRRRGEPSDVAAVLACRSRLEAGAFVNR